MGPSGHQLTAEQEARRLAKFFNLTPYYSRIQAIQGAMQTLSTRTMVLQAQLSDIASDELAIMKSKCVMRVLAHPYLGDAMNCAP